MEVKQIEREAIRLAEEGKYEDSIDSFTNAIRIKPNWASAYNNRAQTYRLAGQTAGELMPNGNENQLLNYILL